MTKANLGSPGREGFARRWSLSASGPQHFSAGFEGVVGADGLEPPTYAL
jgi:hypothetical protein